MSLEIINPSFFTTIQDNGRVGYCDIGVTNSGVMDSFAYNTLNMLLNNPKNSNAIEISFSNFEVKFLENTQMGVCGSDALVYLNEKQISLWQTHNVKKGDILKVGKFLSGAKLYFTVKDGFEIHKEFGSNSTTIKEKLGGLNGNFLKKGDILKYKYINAHHNSKLKKSFIPKYSDTLELRVMLTYQDNSFDKSEIDKFFNCEYTITNDFNRMACKLRGKEIKSNINGIISEGIVLGSIQIPSDGQPIILLNDRQTIGGYPKIGVVLDIDCYKLSQAKPNTKIRFKEISISEATIKSKEFYCCFNL